MSRPRNLAFWILNAVVRFAPVGAAEWARAMLCEIDFIDSDWDAFCWALGGARILFTRPQMPFAESAAPWPVEDLARKVRRRTVFGYSLASTMTTALAYLFYMASSPVQRLGCCVGIVAMFYTWVQLFTLRARNEWSIRESSECPRAYRTELQRQRDFYRGLWFWSRISMVVCGFVLFCVGGVVAHPESVPGYAEFATFLISMFCLAVWSNARESRKYQDQIEKIDKLPSQASNIH